MKQLRRILYYVCISCRPNSSRTVRFAFPLLLVAASMLGAAALLHSGTSYIRIESTEQYVAAGDRFSINVFVGAHTPVNAVDIALTYPREQIKVLGIDTGESVITLWTEEPKASGGTISLRGGTFRKGFVGEHLIATVNVEATESGKAEFSTESVQLLAGDGRGTEINVSKTGKESITLQVAAEDGVITGDVEIKIATDIDGDGTVSLKDVMAFMSAWLAKDTVYDFNNDRRMNFTDFSIILADSFFGR